MTEKPLVRIDQSFINKLTILAQRYASDYTEVGYMIEAICSEYGLERPQGTRIGRSSTLRLSS